MAAQAGDPASAESDGRPAGSSALAVAAVEGEAASPSDAISSPSSPSNEGGGGAAAPGSSAETAAGSAADQPEGGIGPGVGGGDEEPVIVGSAVASAHPHAKRPRMLNERAGDFCRATLPVLNWHYLTRRRSFLSLSLSPACDEPQAAAMAAAAKAGISNAQKSDSPDPWSGETAAAAPEGGAAQSLCTGADAAAAVGEARRVVGIIEGGPPTPPATARGTPVQGTPLGTPEQTPREEA